MGLDSILLEFLRRPTVVDVVGRLMIFLARIWIGIIVGVLVGWVWKPKWASFSRELLDSSALKNSLSTASSKLQLQLPALSSWTSNDGVEKEVFTSTKSDRSSSQKVESETATPVREEDLNYLFRLVEERDGGPVWIPMMDRSTPTMGYRAWRRDLESGPPQYRSSTIFEDATPEMVRDFFWDDEFRLKWDDMLMDAETLEESSTTGAMVVRWVRKFPFFCSDREYVIGRRIWQSGQSFYCVTKGVRCPLVPRQNKPRRVDLYYSSWCIHPVESRKGDGSRTACEVLLFHYEDMGIPWEIAKLGVRQGMWGAVKKIEPGLRAYQEERSSGASLSHCAQLAQINTKVSSEYLRCLESSGSSDSSLEVEKTDEFEKPGGKNIPKIVFIGGAIALACGLDQGLLTKAVIFGVARQFGKIGRRL